MMTSEELLSQPKSVAGRHIEDINAQTYLN